MWKKPEVIKSSFENINLEQITSAEAKEIKGGAYWGNCYIKGYACNSAKGGWQYGMCMGVGTHTGWC